MALTLNQLIRQLNALPAGTLVTGIDSQINSWRGSYDEHAVTPSSTVIGARVLAKRYLRQVGKTVRGWKGGEFPVRLDKPVHLASHGDIGVPITGLEQGADGIWTPTVGERA